MSINQESAIANVRLVIDDLTRERDEARAECEKLNAAVSEHLKVMTPRVKELLAGDGGETSTNNADVPYISGDDLKKAAEANPAPAEFWKDTEQPGSVKPGDDEEIERLVDCVTAAVKDKTENVTAHAVRAVRDAVRAKGKAEMERLRARVAELERECERLRESVRSARDEQETKRKALLRELAAPFCNHTSEPLTATEDAAIRKTCDFGNVVDIKRLCIQIIARRIAAPPRGPMTPEQRSSLDKYLHTAYAALSEIAETLDGVPALVEGLFAGEQPEEIKP